MIETKNNLMQSNNKQQLIKNEKEDQNIRFGHRFVNNKKCVGEIIK